MQDENLRRLLHQSKKEKVSSYLEQEKETNIRCVRSRVSRHFAILKRVKRGIDACIESSLTPLGVIPLWVADYAEIADRLGNMYEYAGDDWSLVY